MSHEMKNGINRRTAAGVLASLPFLGKVNQLAPKQAGAAIGAMIGGGAAQAECGPLNHPYPQMPKGPKIQEWQAMRLAMQDPDIRRLVVSQTFEQQRIVASIDPDIEVLRSFSPMAKITFQRQRNVERAIQQATEAPIWETFSAARDFIRRAMWG
jgi:hypothetical protein